MPDFVDGEVFWFLEFVGGGGEGAFFEEIPDFVAGGEEVGVADVGVFVFPRAGGEFGHGVGGEREVGKEGVGFAEERGGG